MTQTKQPKHRSFEAFLLATGNFRNKVFTDRKKQSNKRACRGIINPNNL